MMVYTLMEMLASESLKMDEWEDLSDAYQQAFQYFLIDLFVF